MTKLGADFNRRIIEKASSGGGVAINLHRHQKVADNLFRVFYTVDTPRKLEQAEIATALSSAVGENFQVLAHTVGQRLSNSKKPVYTALVLPNRMVQAYSDEAVKDMKLVTANLFRDAEDNLWKKVEDNGVEHLVQTTQDNYEEILSARRSYHSTPITAALDPQASSNGAQPGYWVTYYNPARFAYSEGYYMQHKGQTVVANDEEVVPIDPEQIVEFDDEIKLPAEEVAALGQADINKLIDYYKKLYGENSPVYTRLRELIRKRNAMTV